MRIKWRRSVCVLCSPLQLSGCRSPREWWKSRIRTGGLRSAIMVGHPKILEWFVAWWDSLTRRRSTRTSTSECSWHVEDLWQVVGRESILSIRIVIGQWNIVTKKTVKTSFTQMNVPLFRATSCVCLCVWHLTILWLFSQCEWKLCLLSQSSVKCSLAQQHTHSLNHRQTPRQGNYCILHAH